MVTLPPGLREIGLGAFSSTSIEEVIFEEGSELETTGINVSADIIFSNCAQPATILILLRSINIYAGLL